MSLPLAAGPVGTILLDLSSSWLRPSSATSGLIGQQLVVVGMSILTTRFTPPLLLRSQQEPPRARPPLPFLAAIPWAPSFDDGGDA